MEGFISCEPPLKRHHPDTPLFTLPRDVIHLILCKSPPSSLLNLLCVCRALHDMIVGTGKLVDPGTKGLLHAASHSYIEYYQRWRNTKLSDNECFRKLVVSATIEARPMLRFLLPRIDSSLLMPTLPMTPAAVSVILDDDRMQNYTPTASCITTCGLAQPYHIQGGSLCMQYEIACAWEKRHRASPGLLIWCATLHLDTAMLGRAVESIPDKKKKGKFYSMEYFIPAFERLVSVDCNASLYPLVQRFLAAMIVEHKVVPLSALYQYFQKTFVPIHRVNMSYAVAQFAKFTHLDIDCVGELIYEDNPRKLAYLYPLIDLTQLTPRQVSFIQEQSQTSIRNIFKNAL